MFNDKMKQAMALILCLIAVSACSSHGAKSDKQSSYEDDLAFRNFQKEAITDESKMLDSDAEQTWKKAVAYFDSHNKTSDQATEARWSLAKYYQLHGNFATAQTLFSQILADKERLSLGPYQGLPGNISDLADCYYFRGQYKQAADLYLRAISCAQMLTGTRGQIADTRKLANCYAHLGNKRLAESFYQQSIVLSEQLAPLVGPVHGYVVALDAFMSIKDYATMLALSGNLSELAKLKNQETLLAAKLISQASTPDSMLAGTVPGIQKLYQKLQSVPNLSAINQLVYRATTNAAVIACRDGKYAEAEDLYERLLELALSTNGSKATLADFYHSLHRQWCNCQLNSPPNETGEGNLHIENPYLTAFQLIRTRQEYFDKRLTFTHKFAWAIPDDTALDTIASCAPIIEIGAGTGYWAYLLRQKHVDVVADDLTPVPSKDNLWHYRAGASWTNVLAGDENLPAKYPGRTLMLCWPDGGLDLFSYKALSKYKGNRLIYIGEEAGGLTGCPQFFDLLRSQWHLVKKVEIPRWPGNYDSLYVLERNS
jgi:tetratricopeptide (TPR) repeat protein